MSQQSVEIVRAHIEAFRRDDFPGALIYLDADIVLDTTRVQGIDGALAHGHEEVLREVRRWIGAFGDYDFEEEQATDLGGGRVAVVVAERGRGRASGAPVGRTMAGLYDVLDGKIARITWYLTKQAALEAVGLSE